MLLFAFCSSVFIISIFADVKLIEDYMFDSITNTGLSQIEW